jgi:hypothetical protein
LRITLTQAMPPELRLKLVGMRALPMGLSADIDSSQVTQVAVFVPKPPADCVIEIGSPRAWYLSEPNEPIGEDDVFPMIDEFGQFIHKEWKGKIHSADDLKANKEAEEADLAANPGPADWDQWGGWKTGPQLKATGFFRTEKYNGKWWFVDPDGHLFWSMGINCVNTNEGRTALTDREHWFQNVPKREPPFDEFYSSNDWAPHGYYKGHEYLDFHFTAANFFRKHGDNWQKQFFELANQRLRSWGINTIAAMSDGKAFLKKTPYATMCGANSKKLAGSSGYWRKFPDVFDQEFVDNNLKDAANHKNELEDPWCIGVFVENELGWGDEVSLPIATLCSPADQAAKLVFIGDLKKKYDAIDKLNAAWGSDYASWDALLQSRTPPNQEKAGADLRAFSTKTAERYFEVMHDSVKAAAPNALDLGCRFSRSNPLAVRAAAKFCDVVSFNRYQYSLADLRLPEGADKPVIIGEFQFGATDRGMFHPSLGPTADQIDRAKTYKEYVESALGNPWIVGVHWFEYTDQMSTGRGDEENYQIGFVDICDTPYPELIETARAIGNKLYEYRNAP